MKKILNLESFAEEVSAAIKARTEAEVTINKVSKNNGLVLTGITIKGNSNLAPTVYLEHFYDKYTDFEMSLDEVVDQVIETAETQPVENDVNVEFYADWEQVRKRISMKLVNYDKNKRFLEDTPHMVYGDLAIIFQVILSEEIPVGKASITVKTQHMKNWGKNTEDLYIAAESNRYSFTVRSMFEVLYEMIGESVEGNVSEEENNLMYVVSNTDKLNGAIAMEDKELLRDFAREHGSFYIIPSSIHELILVPAKEMDDEEKFNDMINEVNSSEVSCEDYLSDHAYFFDAREEKLLIHAYGSEMIPVAGA